MRNKSFALATGRGVAKHSLKLAASIGISAVIGLAGTAPALAFTPQLQQQKQHFVDCLKLLLTDLDEHERLCGGGKKLPLSFNSLSEQAAAGPAVVAPGAPPVVKEEDCKEDHDHNGHHGKDRDHHEKDKGHGKDRDDDKGHGNDRGNDRDDDKGHGNDRGNDRDDDKGHGNDRGNDRDDDKGHGNDRGNDRDDDKGHGNDRGNDNDRGQQGNNNNNGKGGKGR